jgi:hypothetical protein
VWLYILALAIVGSYAAAFIPAFAGQKLTPVAGNGILLWTALLFYVVWKRRGRKGWHGTLIGLGAGFVVLVLASYISAVVRHGAGG